MDNLYVFLLSMGVMYLILASTDRRRARASPPKRAPPSDGLPAMQVAATPMVVMHEGRLHGVARDFRNRMVYLYPLRYPLQGRDREAGGRLGPPDYANCTGMTEIEFQTIRDHEQGALRYGWYR